LRVILVDLRGKGGNKCIIPRQVCGLIPYITCKMLRCIIIIIMLQCIIVITLRVYGLIRGMPCKDAG
jgi:hypothetical protein